MLRPNLIFKYFRGEVFVVFNHVISKFYSSKTSVELSVHTCMGWLSEGVAVLIPENKKCTSQNLDTILELKLYFGCENTDDFPSGIPRP